MSRRRPMAVGLGLGLAAVYLLAAVATLVLSDRPFRPLFDGLAPPPPYRWVNPPGETARDNQQPAAARREAPFGPDGSPFVNVTPEDGQAIVLLQEKAIASHPPDTAVEVAATPLDVLTLGPLPDDVSPQGNAYRVTVTYRPSGQPVTDVTPGSSSVALVAAGPSDYLFYSRDGQNWDRRETTPLGGGHGLETRFAGTGYYVVTSIAVAGGGGGASPLVVVVVLLVPPLLVGGLVLRSRRAKAAAEAKAAAAAAKRRGGPPKGGRKSKRRKR